MWGKIILGTVSIGVVYCAGVVGWSYKLLNGHNEQAYVAARSQLITQHDLDLVATERAINVTLSLVATIWPAPRVLYDLVTRSRLDCQLRIMHRCSDEIIHLARLIHEHPADGEGLDVIPRENATDEE